MDVKDGFGFLKGTTDGHVEFHRARIMFYVRDGKIEAASPGSPNSHIEWFESKGWAAQENIREFLDNNIRGFYLPDSNELYCYKGAGWYFDNDLLAELLENITGLEKALGFNEGTKINLGPKDAVINGARYERKYIGTLGELAGRGWRAR